MKKFNLVILLFIIISISCNNSNNIEPTINNITYTDFPTIENLDYEIIPLDTIWRPSNIYYLDNKLIVIDETQDFMAQIFDLEKNTKIAENIRFGQGPQESLDCWKMQFTDNKILLFSYQTRKLKIYDKTNFITKSNINCLEDLDFNNISPQTIVQLSNNNFVGSCRTDENNFLTLLDKSGHIIKSVSQFPNFSSIKNYSNHDKKIALENRVLYNFERERVVVPYVYTDLLDIYDNDLNLISRIHGPIGYEPKMLESEQFIRPSASCSKISSVNVCLTNKNIWLVFEAFSGSCNQILVFDYNGHPIRVFNLNVNIIGLAVDDVNNTFYSIVDNPEYCVVKFKYNIDE